MKVNRATDFIVYQNPLASLAEKAPRLSKKDEEKGNGDIVFISPEARRMYFDRHGSSLVKALSRALPGGIDGIAGLVQATEERGDRERAGRVAELRAALRGDAGKGTANEKIEGAAQAVADQLL